MKAGTIFSMYEDKGETRLTLSTKGKKSDPLLVFRLAGFAVIRVPGSWFLCRVEWIGKNGLKVLEIIREETPGTKWAVCRDLMVQEARDLGIVERQEQKLQETEDRKDASKGLDVMLKSFDRFLAEKLDVMETHLESFDKDGEKGFRGKVVMIPRNSVKTVLDLMWSFKTEEFGVERLSSELHSDEVTFRVETLDLTFSLIFRERGGRREHIIRSFIHDQDAARDTLDKFRESVKKDPLNAFGWGDSALYAAGRFNVARSLLRVLETPTAPIRSIYRELRGNVTMFSGHNSTALMSNAAKASEHQAQLDAMRRILELFPELDAPETN